MEISPKRVDGKLYVPYSLSDAWRQLDHMLPKSFVWTMVDHTTAAACAVDLDRNTGVVHDAMVGFIFDNWLNTDDTIYSRFISRTFDLDEREMNANSGYNTDVRSLAAAWTLCAYYHYKRSKGHPDPNEFTRLFVEELRDLEARPGER